MRRLIVHICLLGLAFGVTCGLLLISYEGVRYHLFLGYNLDVFGRRFEGSVGQITYSMTSIPPFLIGFACLGGWFAWGVAAANRPGRTTIGSAESVPTLRGSAWLTAVLFGGLAAVVWIALGLTVDIPAVRPIRSSNLVRSVVLVALFAICIERFHEAGQHSSRRQRQALRGGFRTGIEGPGFR